MEQKLALQRQNQKPRQKKSFFACLDCFADPENSELVVGEKIWVQKNGSNNYIYTQRFSKQDKKVSVSGKKIQQIHQTDREIHPNENKKDVISLRKSIKTNTVERQSLALPEKVYFDHKNYYEGPKVILDPLLIQNNTTNFIKNNPKQGLEHVNKAQQYRSNVGFSYSRQPLSNQNVSPVPQIQSRQKQPYNISNQRGPATKQMNMKDLPRPPSKNQKSWVQASQQILEEASKQPNKNQPKGNQGNKGGNLGNGRFSLEMRQAVSIVEAEQQRIQQSIVISKGYNYQQKNLLNSLRPITESELQASSFMDNNPLNR